MDTYQLRKLQIGTKPKYDLELLQHFGIIRPFMLRRLIDLRNSVEHTDSSPPPTDECLMFADLVWYFLRSTDGLIGMQVERIFFYPPGTDISSPGVQIVLDFCEPLNKPFDEPPNMGAWLDPSSLAYEPRKNWTRIASAKVTQHEEAEASRVSVSGRMGGPDEQMRRMYELYFSTSHFR
jgi:hypothetical protein